MRAGTDMLMVVAMAAIGLVSGLLFSPQPVWAVVGLVLGVGLGMLMARAGMRPAVGPAIAAGGAVGAWIGREIVRALCLPGSCTGVEIAGAVFSSAGAMVGIGLVVALVVRSFDEYRHGGRRGSQSL